MRTQRAFSHLVQAGITCSLLWALVPTHGLAQDNPAQEARDCAPVGVRTDVRPDPSGQPTEVSVAMFMVDLTKVDDVAQSFTGDFIVPQSWADPRLAELEGCQHPLASVWHPQLDFLNSGPMLPRRSEDADQVEIGPEGLVQHQRRYFGSLATYQSLKEFPFDQHVFQISLWYRARVQPRREKNRS